MFQVYRVGAVSALLVVFSACSGGGPSAGRDAGTDAARYDGSRRDVRPLRDRVLADRQAPMEDARSDGRVSRCGAYDFCVDPVLGDDATGDGSAAAPFRTLSRAMAAAGPGSRIGVRAGVLSAASGEQFPIRFRRGVVVEGMDAPQDRPVVQGGDPAFVLADGSGLSGMEVRASGVAVQCTDCGTVRISGVVVVVARETGVEVAGGASDLTVEDVWFVASAGRTRAASCSGSDNRMEFLGTAFSGPFDEAVRMEGCKVSFSNADFDVDGVGLLIGPGAEATARDCGFRDGRVGIRVEAGAAGLDLGTAGDPGGNELRGAGDADLCHLGEILVHAVGNIWDHDPPEVAGGCTGGTDIGLVGSGSVETE